jgi:hypothetical protein
MNLTLTIVRKDLFRLRWWLLAWIVVLALPIGLGFQFQRQVPFIEAESGWQLMDTLKSLQCLEVLCGYLLVILLLQEDAIIGTQQFWLTRPISRGRLLRAKAIGILVMLGLLPIAISLPWWLWCGLGLPTMALVAGDLLMIMVLIALPAALVATLTETFSRALLWSLVLAAAILTAIAAVPIMVATGNSVGLIATRLLLAVLVVGAEIAAVTLFVFLTRRRSPMLVGAAAIVVVSFVLALLSKWHWWSNHPVEHHTERAAGITMRFEGAMARPPDLRVPERRQNVSAKIIVGGIPTTKMLVPVGGDQVWRSKDVSFTHEFWPSWRSNLARSFELLGLHAPPEDAETTAWQAARGEVRPKPRAKDEGELYLEAYLQRSVVARLIADRPDFEAKVFVAQLEPELVFEVPLRRGEKARGNDHSVRIAEVIPTPQNPHVSSRTTLVLTRPITSWFILREFARSDTWVHYVQSLADFQAFHRGRGEFTSVREDKSRTIVVNGVGVIWMTLAVSPGWVHRGREWVQRPGWVEGVSLALVGMKEDATIARVVRAEKVRIENSGASDGQTP